MKQIDDNTFSFSARAQNKELNILLTALDTTKAGLVITDCAQPDDPIVYCNKTFETLSGYNRQEIIGHNCRFLQGNDDNLEQRQHIKAAMQAGESCTVEIRNYKKDGSLFWNELHLEPLKDDTGRTIYYLGVQNDITKTKLANQQVRIEKLKIEKQFNEQQHQLLENDSLLAKLLETITDSVLILAEDLTIIKANPAFLKTFHMAEDEILNMHLFAIDNGRWDMMGLHSLMDNLTKKKKNIQNYLLEDIPTRIGNKMLSFEANFYVHNHSQYIILAINDITELREVERRKDDFLSIASHELKTPLTTITASLQLLQRMLPADTNEQLKTTLNKSKIYVDKLEHLITDLLDASKIKSGQIALSKEPFDLDLLITETTEELRTKYPEYTLTIEGFASNYYMGDKRRLQQVIFQLLTNAIKFSPKGSTIMVHLARLSDFIKVAINDSGLGVAYQYQKKIFETFFRVDEIQKQYPGIGIGLYVSNQIIKQHGGTLWVESTVGEGATFSFTLPLKIQQP